MMFEAVRYGGYPADVVSNLPTTNWTSRNDKAGLAGHGIGMSYSYGSRDTIQSFNAKVARCKAPKTYTKKVPVIKDGKPLYRNNKLVMEEKFDHTDVSDSYDGHTDIDNCSSLIGDHKYTGRNIYEFNEQQRKTQFTRNDTTGFDYWTGIDCSGLLQNTTKYSVNTLKRSGTANIGNKMTAGITTSILNSVQNKNVYVYDLAINDSRARQGDIVRYPGHVSIVQSERVYPERKRGLKYSIIHAYGTDSYTFVDSKGRKLGQTIFSRKVVHTGDDLWSEKKENDKKYLGFGRIKLWD